MLYYMLMTKSEYGYILSWAKKIKALSVLGGRCSSCGKNHPAILDFHHIKGNKKGLISKLKFYRWSRIIQEANKCIVLCRNCHIKRHSRLTSRTQLMKRKYLEQMGISSCKKCGENDARALDFHHVGWKSFVISDLLQRKVAPKNGLLELNKCSVLCRNCHTLHHFDEEKFQTYYDVILKKADGLKEANKVDHALVLELHRQGKSYGQISQKTGHPKSSIAFVIQNKGQIMDP